MCSSTMGGRPGDLVLSLLEEKFGALVTAALAERAVDPVPAALPDPATTTVAHGRVTAARPALSGYDDYSFPARPWGADPATWA